MADERFSALSSDPRYRLPNRKQSRTAVDPRFKRLFKDQDFRSKATVDRYGRKIAPESEKKDLKRQDKGEKLKSNEVLGGKAIRDVVGSSDSDSEAASSQDEVFVGARDAARQGGFSESSSDDEESDSEEEIEDEAELADETAGQEQTEVPAGEASHRLAAVNLDWDNIRATDVMAVASSFAPKTGRIKSVTIYPSEFGRERMEREELEGPPREIFASSKRERHLESEDDEEESEEEDEKIKRQLQQDQVGHNEEFDTAKLRQYQLERLRYYYAVITCDSIATGQALYDAMDGREYLTTSNFFDLRFIPNDTSFEDDKPHDERTQLPSGYKPNDFRTEALTHSKVRLTWDDDDATRKEVQKRAFSRVEMDENDLQAYIGSESSDADSISSRKSAAEERKLKKKEAAKEKTRAALGLTEESAPFRSLKKGSKDEVVGDMQVTFTSGLGAGSGKDEKGVFENEPQDEESTRARYIRKEKERKQKRKDRMKTSKSGVSDLAGPESGDEGPVLNEDGGQGFDDPFFNDPSASAAAEKKAKKADRLKKLDAQTQKDEEAASRRAELELLMADAQEDNLRHFDMREIEKAKKEAKRRDKKHKKKDQKQTDEGAPVDSFKVETEDPRFKALFESHEYAIDPTNPKFKGTEGMKALLEEGRKKKRKHAEGEDAEVDGQSKKGKKVNGGDGGGGDDLKGLVKRLQGGKKAKR